MKTFPLTLNQIQTLATQFPTPFHLYDETAIRDNARRLTRAFSILPGFREFFAVKATPNPFLLRILASEGFGADCSSLAELRLCEAVGITGERIMFTSNETPDEEFRVARDLGAIINLDDITHMDALIAATGSLPKTLCFRYNPGPLKAGNAIIGKPEEAKYGLTREQLFEAYARARDLDVQTFGLHTMVVSNELDEQYHIETARMLLEQGDNHIGFGAFRIDAISRQGLFNAVRQSDGGGHFAIPFGKCITHNTHRKTTRQAVKRL